MTRLIPPAIVFSLLLAGVALAQRQPPVADPAEKYRIEGLILQPGGEPAAGTRVRGHKDSNPSLDLFDTTTDTEGRFRFQHSGLGFPSSRWHMVVSRPKCPDFVVATELHSEDGDGFTKVDLSIQLPVCP
jgi:hypothetical protein